MEFFSTFLIYMAVGAFLLALTIHGKADPEIQEIKADLRFMGRGAFPLLILLIGFMPIIWVYAIGSTLFGSSDEEHH